MDEIGEWFGEYIRDRKRDGRPLDGTHIAWLESHPEVAEAIEEEEAARALAPPPAAANTDLSPSAAAPAVPAAPPATPWAPTPLAELPPPKYFVLPGLANPERAQADYGGLLALGYRPFARSVDGIKVNGIIQRPEMDEHWALSLAGLAEKKRREDSTAGVGIGGVDALVMNILSHQFSGPAEEYWAEESRKYLYLDKEPAYLIVDPSLDEGDLSGLVLGRSFFVELERDDVSNPSVAEPEPLGVLDEKSLEIEIDVGPRRPAARPFLRTSLPKRGRYRGFGRGSGAGSPFVSESARFAAAQPEPPLRNLQYTLVLREKREWDDSEVFSAAAHCGPPPADSEITLVLRQKRKRDGNEGGEDTETPATKR